VDISDIPQVIAGGESMLNQELEREVEEEIQVEIQQESQVLAMNVLTDTAKPTYYEDLVRVSNDGIYDLSQFFTRMRPSISNILPRDCRLQDQETIEYSPNLIIASKEFRGRTTPKLGSQEQATYRLPCRFLLAMYDERTHQKRYMLLSH